MEYLSQKQIADKLGVPKQKIYRCIKQYCIKEAHTETVKGNTVLMYDKQAIEQIESILQGGATTSNEAHSEVHHEAVNEAVLKQLEILNEQLKAKDTHIANLDMQNANLLKQMEEKDKLHHEEKMNLQQLLEHEQQLNARNQEIIKERESKQALIEQKEPVEVVEPDEPPTPQKGFWSRLFKK